MSQRSGIPFSSVKFPFPESSFISLSKTFETARPQSSRFTSSCRNQAEIISSRTSFSTTAARLWISCVPCFHGNSSFPEDRTAERQTQM